MADTVKICTDKDAVLAYLKKIDYTLPVPLSARVDLLKFAMHAVEKGLTFTVEENGEIACAILFYYGYPTAHDAYLDLIATVPGYEGRGYARLLLDAAEERAIKDGMTGFHLHVNATNPRALSLYERRGYKIVEREPKIHMAKDLTKEF